MFDIKKLKTLIAIAEESSLTKAAMRLNTSQSWVSEQLRLMEERLDVALVHRIRGKFLRLTPAGERVAVIARRAVTAFDEASAEMEDMRGRAGKRVVIGTDPMTMAMPARNRLIIDFLHHHPTMELQIDNASHDELFAGLRHGRFDMILALCPCPEPDVEMLPLYHHEVVMAVPNGKAVSEHAGNMTVLGVPETFHPAYLSWLREALEPANLSWKACPEASFEALIRYAIFSRTPAVLPNVINCFPQLADRVTARSLNLPRPMVAHWALMRLPGYHRRASTAFWNLAARQSATSIDASPDGDPIRTGPTA